MKFKENIKKIAFFLSGNGSTLENLFEYINKNNLNALIAIVISSKKSAYGVIRAKKLNIPVKVIPYINYKNNAKLYSNEITNAISPYNIDLIVFGGFLSKYIVPKQYENKVINIHPSLLPSFSGKGFYGDMVHKAVLDYGVKVSGCTVHFVNNDYDKGPIIAQEVVFVEKDDTIDSLHHKVNALEKNIYPKIIKLILENKVFLMKGKVLMEEDYTKL